MLYPIFVLSYASASFVVPKEILLGALGGLAIIAWVAEAITKKALSFKVGKFDLPVLLIVLAYVLSAIFATPNKMEAFLFPGTVTFIIASAVLYFLINQFDAKTKDGVKFTMVISGVLLSLVGLFAQVGVLAKIPQLPAYIKDVNFNPMGGVLPALIYLGVAFILSGELIIKQKDAVYKLFVGVCAAVMLLGITVLFKNVLPGQSQNVRVPDFNTSWQIGLETIKQAPLLGVGPANYLTAFNRFRPITYNSSDLWQVRFTTATDFYLTVLTELGFAGVIAFGAFLWLVYKTVRKEFNIKYIPLIVLLVLFAVLPASQILMVLLFVLLATVSGSENKTVNVLGEASAKPAVFLVTLPVIAALGLLYFVGFGWVRAEKTFAKSLDALTANDAQGTYTQMSSAITQNQNVDRYHASLAQVDMAFASSLASKKDITDTDKSTVTQLVQQAINEGKATVTLNPGRSGNWELLAQIYRSIMPFANGADQYAIQTYLQAVALDPTSPDLRISLGGVYYALGRYDDAIDSFKLAVLAKSDYANAHYNLSVAYSAKKDYDNAIAEMKNVLSLVAKDSQDATLAQNVLNDLEKQKPAAPATSGNKGSQNLTAPQPVGTSNIKPPITLPKEATPPASTQP